MISNFTGLIQAKIVIKTNGRLGNINQIKNGVLHSKCAVPQGTRPPTLAILCSPTLGASSLTNMKFKYSILPLNNIAPLCK
jgi:hypothetical protein